MRKTSNKFQSMAIEVLGWLLVVIGILALVLPGPGLLMLFAGLTLLSTRYEWAERRLEPVKAAALKAAHDGVTSWPRLLGSSLAVVALVSLGIFWGIGPTAPTWWPFAEKFWLIGGWGTGGTLIGSGIIAAAMLIYSFVHFRPDKD